MYFYLIYQIKDFGQPSIQKMKKIVNQLSMHNIKT